MNQLIFLITAGPYNQCAAFMCKVQAQEFLKICLEIKKDYKCNEGSYRYFINNLSPEKKVIYKKIGSDLFSYGPEITEVHLYSNIRELLNE